MLRVAFITYEYPPDIGKGGIGTYSKQVATLLSSLGWDIHVFSGSSHRELKENINGVQIHRVQCSNPYDFRERVVPVFQAENAIQPFDLLESPEIHGNAWEIKKIFPELPLVIRLHAPNYLVESLKRSYVPFFAKLRYVAGSLKRLRLDMGFWRSYNKNVDPDYQFIKIADYITAPSSSMKDWVIQNWNINDKEITVIPNIFNPSNDFLQIPVSEKELFKRVVFFGRLNVLKGLVNAGKAMKKILKKYPDYQFRIIGDDGEGPTGKNSMRAWLQNELMEVIDRVEFLNGMDYEKLPAYIHDCDIVLLPSLFESFSYTCAEAMAAGKAVIGSNKGGMKDMITDNKSGILIDPYSEKEIYHALEKLIIDNTMRYQCALHARQAILHNFNESKTLSVLTGFYKDVSAGKFETKN